MLIIIFETHATTLDNEAGLSSGHADAELSALGEEQSRELGRRYNREAIDAVLCSDLKRSYGTAAIAFADRDVPIITDQRLREIDYGHYTRHPTNFVEALGHRYVTRPFPNGESYEEVVRRVRDLLGELNRRYAAGRVLLIGHRAVQYALEHLVNDVPLPEAISASWQWQPGWRYELHEKP